MLHLPVLLRWFEALPWYLLFFRIQLGQDLVQRAELLIERSRPHREAISCLGFILRETAISLIKIRCGSPHYTFSLFSCFQSELWPGAMRRRVVD